MPQIGNLSVSVYREESKTTGELTDAVCKASPEFAPVALDSTGYRGGRSYRYASIKAIRRATQPSLSKYGLWLHHIYGNNNEGTYVVTVLRHRSGEYMTSTLLVPPRQDIQEQKAAMTMLCRIATEGLLAICTEEDDDAACLVVSDTSTAAQREQWDANLLLALKAISEAKSEADVSRFFGVAKTRVTEGVMAPDALTKIQAACDVRRDQLQEKSNADSAGAAGDQGTDAARVGSSTPNRPSRGSASGTGRGDVPVGDKRAGIPA